MTKKIDRGGLRLDRMVVSWRPTSRTLESRAKLPQMVPVVQSQPARRLTEPLIYLYLSKRHADIDVLAGNDEITVGHRQDDRANAAFFGQKKPDNGFQ
jgi:hypothetical protein